MKNDEEAASKVVYKCDFEHEGTNLGEMQVTDVTQASTQTFLHQIEGNLAPENELLPDNSDVKCSLASLEKTNYEECIPEETNLEYSESFPNTEYNVAYDFSRTPIQITGSWKEFDDEKRNNFTKGCKWAPDGSCILSCSDDNILRIFNLPDQIWDASQWSEIKEMEAVVKIPQGELIYDYCWYPQMNSSDPCSCCLASTSKDSTIHLLDGFTGKLRCSYQAYNHLDEVVAARSICFDSTGDKIFSGFSKYIRIFNVNIPGRSCEERRVFANQDGQPGIISCFAFTAANQNISVAGSYGKTIGIYSEPSGNLEHLLEGQKGGVTQVQFSPDGLLLYSGGRKDPEILCWDLRNLGTILYSFRRNCTTSQRMQFDISRCGRYVISGNRNGVISVWDITKECHVVDFSDFDVLEPTQFFLSHEDCVNGISLHPFLPLLCSSSGQRKIPQILPEEDDKIFGPDVEKKDNSLRLWWLGQCS